MSDFIPELDNLRSAWVRSRAKREHDGQSYGQFWEKKAEQEFDRAIAKVRADAKAEALREAVGFVVVDIKSRKMDWDGEMHPTREAAIESLTDHPWWCRTPEEATDERTYYGDVYEILAVTP